MKLPASAYRTAFEDAPDGMVIFAPETGRICECNTRFAALAGRDCETLLDRDILSLVTTEHTAESDSPADRWEGDDGTATWHIETDSETTVVADVRWSRVTLDGAERILARVTDATEHPGRVRSLERKARAMDKAPIGITLSDPSREDNPLVYANEGFQRLTGYSSDNIVGRNCRFLQGEATAPEPVAEMREAIDTAEPVVVELRNYREDGSPFWNRVTIAPVRDDDGIVTNFVGFQEDITERKQYERELELAYHLLETVPIGVLRTGHPDGTIEYVNPTLVTLLGAESVEHLTESELEDFYEQPADREELVETLEDGGGAIQYETTFERFDGSTRDVMITASLSEDETGAEHIHEVVQDITDRKEYERQLREQRDNLDILNQMLRHDIRNDLQLVTAYADVLADYVDETGTEYLEKIQTSAANAVELTQTARDMADVMLSTEANRQAVNVGAVLEGELDDVRSEHPDAAITVDGTIPTIPVIANDMLDSVFRNLLSNAVQHNDKEIPEVRVASTVNDETVAVRIADNGPGVPDNQKEEIFGRGEKGLESEGTGIGLYLVETLVESYGGSVRVEDNDPEGTVFVVELPRADLE